MAANRLMEHRWGSRCVLDALAEIKAADGRSARAIVRNASLSGAYLATGERFPMLGRISVRPLAWREEWLDACVVRADGDGIAVEWLDPGEPAVASLLCLGQSPMAAATAAARQATLSP
jgi:hypothetical protein